MTFKKVALIALAAGALLAACSCRSDAADPNWPRSGMKDQPVIASGGVYSWTGIYLGGGIGYSTLDMPTNYSVAPPGPGTIIGIDGFSAAGLTGDARLGADYQFTGTPFVIGILAGYKFGDLDTGFNVPPMGGLFATASLRETWYVGGRVGAAFGPSGQSLAYVGYAYTQADLDIGAGMTAGPVNFCAAPTPLVCGHSLNGHRLLVGLETRLTRTLNIGIEGTYTRYDSVNVLAATAAPASINLDPDVYTVMVRLNWRPATTIFNPQ